MILRENMTVLLVDDAVSNLQLLQEYLKDQPYELETAENGQLALELLEANPHKYHTVLLDRIMPVMDGMELLKRMKESPELKIIPVIFQTSRDSAEDVTAGLQAGARYYLTKPVKVEELQSAIKSSLDEYSQIFKLISHIKKEIHGLSLIASAEFVFRTLQEGDALASLLANTCPNAEQIVFGLSELLINAVEHGNLGITYKEKTELCKAGIWIKEVNKRLKMDEYSNKVVKVEFRREIDHIRIKITDEGAGFDWQQYMEFAAERAFDNHGRGIATANQISFNKVEYMGRGNIVEVTINLS